MLSISKINKSTFPIFGIALLIPIVPIWYWITAHDEMHFPPMDLAVYKRAADFASAGISPYSPEFTNIGGALLPWVYTPFGTLFISPLHYVSNTLLLEVWSIVAIAIPTMVLVALGYQSFFANKFLEKSEKIFLFILFFILGLLTGPVLDAWALGQIGVLLAALTLFDLSAPESWFYWKKFKCPRGILAGIAGAIKLVPLIVVPYWVITRQWKAAATAIATVITAWFIAFIAMPNDSIEYFQRKLFLGTNNLDNIATSDNQSLIATVMRIKGVHPLPNSTWIPISIIVIFIGLLIARNTYLNGSTLSAGVIVGLTSTLASPISWIHHIAWLVAVPGSILWNRTFRDPKGKITSTGWLWYLSIIILAIPPVRYIWSPLMKMGIKEHYSVLSILIILLLWWRSKTKPISI